VKNGMGPPEPIECGEGVMNDGPYGSGDADLRGTGRGCGSFGGSGIFDGAGCGGGESPGAGNWDGTGRGGNVEGVK